VRSETTRNGTRKILRRVKRFGRLSIEFPMTVRSRILLDLTARVA